LKLQEITGFTRIRARMLMKKKLSGILNARDMCRINVDNLILHIFCYDNTVRDLMHNYYNEIINDILEEYKNNNTETFNITLTTIFTLVSNDMYDMVFNNIV